MAGLSLSPNAGGLLAADNLIPRDRGLVARPGAVQIAQGEVLAAFTWGDRFLANINGQLTAFDDTSVSYLGSATNRLSVAAFQALRSDAMRDDRLYVADGGLPFWIEKNGGSFSRQIVENSLTADSGYPYPVPWAYLIAVWQHRVWVANDSNRVYHSNNEQPESLDPLNAIEFQTGERDGTKALMPHGEALIVACRNSLWAVTGDSPYNFQRSQLVSGRGAAGPKALASDGERLFYVAEKGVFELGRSSPLGGDALGPLFSVPDYGAELLLSPDNLYLWLFAHERLLVIRLADMAIGEIKGPGIRGIWRNDERIGWFGDYGIWVLSDQEDRADTYLNGAETPVSVRYETWDLMSKTRGQDICERVHARIRGSWRALGIYTLAADGVDAYTEPFAMNDADPDLQIDYWDRRLYGGVAPVVREFSPIVAGSSFRHRVEADCHIEIEDFEITNRGDR